MGISPDYVDVAERIREFREKHPDGSLQQVDWKIVEVAGKPFVAYTAAAYRTPDDERPGIGTAWEPVPGPTNFTRDSELMNAETSAWGRAIIAAGAADAKRVASANEIQNREVPADLEAAFANAKAGNAPASPQSDVQAVQEAFNATPANDVPTLRFPAKVKGKRIDDPEVDNNTLDWILTKLDPTDAQWGAENAMLDTAIRRELHRRETVPA